MDMHYFLEVACITYRPYVCPLSRTTVRTNVCDYIKVQ